MLNYKKNLIKKWIWFDLAVAYTDTYFSLIYFVIWNVNFTLMVEMFAVIIFKNDRKIKIIS